MADPSSEGRLCRLRRPAYLSLHPARGAPGTVWSVPCMLVPGSFRQPQLGPDVVPVYSALPLRLPLMSMARAREAVTLMSTSVSSEVSSGVNSSNRNVPLADDG